MKISSAAYTNEVRGAGSRFEKVALDASGLGVRPKGGAVNPADIKPNKPTTSLLQKLEPAVRYVKKNPWATAFGVASMIPAVRVAGGIGKALQLGVQALRARKVAPAASLLARKKAVTTAKGALTPWNRSWGGYGPAGNSPILGLNKATKAGLSSTRLADPRHITGIPRQAFRGYMTYGSGQAALNPSSAFPKGGLFGASATTAAPKKKPLPAFNTLAPLQSLPKR